jgi:hypothetical protein
MSLRTARADLVCRLAGEDPTGIPAYGGELAKLGVAVWKGSVATVLRRHGLPRATQARPELLRSQGEGMLVTDFFMVGSAFLRRYCALFVIEAHSRVAHLLGVTANPDSPWVAQVARNFVAGLEEIGRQFRSWLMEGRSASHKSGVGLSEAMRCSTSSSEMPIPAATQPQGCQ